ncbi:MAG: flagellin [Alphaproteobacteria bacterium]|nr:flagellin [Alphaproteobacteria bacterium]
MVDSISTLGVQLAATKSLSTGTTLLSTLSEQLSTGIYSSNMADYSAANAQKLMNFTSDIGQQNGFLTVIDTISTRLSVYDSALEGVEDIAADSYSSILSASTYNTETNETTKTLIEEYMSQVEYYLNQTVGERYLFSGSRYETAPVGDILSLPSPPTETDPYLATGDTVPAYDTDYDPLDPTATIPEANVKESATIDTTKTLTYGVTSNEEGFQQLIMGLRFAYAATNDEANYDTYMTTARDLISDGLANIRATHTKVTNATSSLENTQTNIEAKIESLDTQIDNIEAVDVNEVAVKITVLQAQLQASYSAVSSLINLSILDYM